jgi:hypothetical protein
MRQQLLLGLLLMVGAGCARNARTDSEPVEPETPRYEHVFLLPMEETLAHTRKLLAEKGYALEPTEDPRMLLTSWQAPMGPSQGNGAYSRYFVAGLRVDDQQSVVRIFRVTRQVAGNDVEIQGGNKKFWLELIERYGNPLERDRFTGEKKALFQTDTFVERRGQMTGSRDLALEKELTLRLESGSGLELLGDSVAPEPERPLARDVGFYLQRWKEDAAKPAPDASACQPAVRGWKELLQKGVAVVIGEQLGTREAPATVGNMVCETALAGHAVAVGLSIPTAEQERIDRYLASPGAPADQDELLRGDFWRRPYQDGRSSRAILDLIDRVRSWRARGLHVAVVAYDTDHKTGSERDAAQADVWLKRRQSQPGERLVILTGNIHGRTVQGAPWDQGFAPMARHLALGGFDVVSLDLSYAQGRRWGCDLDSKDTLQCHVYGATPADRVAERPGLAPYVKLFSQPTEEGYHGVLYVGALSPSPPATWSATRSGP